MECWDLCWWVCDRVTRWPRLRNLFSKNSEPGPRNSGCKPCRPTQVLYEVGCLLLLDEALRRQSLICTP